MDHTDNSQGKNKNPIISVILAGGVGTRLWPLSRTYYPKQFLTLSDRSLFQKTYARARILSNAVDIYVVTNVLHQFLVRTQIKEIDEQYEKVHILSEPVGKNTLPAITWAASELRDRTDDPRVIVFSSDHYLEDTVTGEIKKATALCDEDIIVFGVPPTFPHTGYGYIAPGEVFAHGFRVAAFKEKPDFETATKYLNEGYFWNSGMFLFRLPIFFSELKRYQPALLDAFSEPGCLDYLLLPSISIDNGLLEHSTRVAMVPLTSSWKDLGTFKSWYEISQKDADQNVGVDITRNAKRNFVESGDKEVVLIDVNDTIVVDTDDALLICNMNSSEQIGDVVKQLAARKDPRLDIHSKVYRPWGSYHLLEKGNRYLMKKITVDPGNKLSLQRHHHRSEHWIVVTGMADVILDDAHLMLRPGESTFVPAGIRHRLANSGKIPLVVIEVQIGEYLEEDDIERYEDDFGRECGPNNIMIGMEEEIQQQ